MGKLVVLRIADGDFFQGFPVTLQIAEEGKRPFAESYGILPPAPDIPELYMRWKSDYQNLESSFRIKLVQAGYTNLSDIHKQRRKSAAEFRNRLRDWLNSENRDFQRIRETLLNTLSNHEEIRVIIQAQAPLLQRLPWQEWDLFSDVYTGAEIALSLPEYNRAKRLVSVRARERVRILAILGDFAGIDVGADRESLQSLAGAQTVFLVQPDRRVLSEHLWDERGWDILFFAGHSLTEGETGRIYINETDSLTIDELKLALRKAIDRGLNLAIFNSCDGLGLAKQLAELNIPQVIVMREPVPDLVVQKFFKYFIEAFAGGKSLYSAVREARERLEAFEKEYPGVSWLPVIFQNPAEVPMTWPALSGISPRTALTYLHTLTDHSDLVRSVAISPDGQIIASASLDHTVKLWELASGELLHTLAGHSGPVTCVAFSPDGQTLASSSAHPDGTIKLWDLGSGTLKSTFQGNDWIVSSVWSVAINPDGQILASGHHLDSTVKLWDMGTGKLLRTLKGHVWAVESVAFSSDGQTLASGSLDSNIKIWNPRTGELRRTLNGPEGRFSAIQSWFSSHHIWCIAISPDGQTLASGGSSDQPVKLWCLQTGKLRSTLTGHTVDVYSVAISSDGQTLASAGADCTIRIWNLLTGEPIHTLEHSDSVYSVAFSPDGQTIVSGSKDGTIKVWQSG